MTASVRNFFIFGIIMLAGIMVPDCVLPVTFGADSLNTVIPADSSGKKTDTVQKTELADSAGTIATDTILPSSLPLKQHGSTFIAGEGAPAFTIEKEDLLYIQYMGLTDIIKEKAPAFPLTLGSFSQFAGLSFFGGSPAGVDVSFNNRSLNDVNYGSFNLEQFSPEFLEKIEILTGTDAVVLHDNCTGAAVNIQEIMYNTSKPYTRLFFTEASDAGNHFTGDGVFSQNFMRNINFTFGFRGISGNGRDENSFADSWHIRGLLRWNPSDRMSLSLTENYFNHNLGLSGGNEETDKYGKDVNREVLYPGLVEKLFRHNLALSFSYIADKDSINSFFLTSSLDNSEWHHSSKSENFDRDTVAGYQLKKYTTEKYGLTGYYNFDLRFINIKAGGNFDYINSPGSDYTESYDGQSTSLFAHARLNLYDYVKLSFGSRIRQTKNKQSALSIGVKSEFTLADNFALNLDLSESDRLPTLAEGASLNKETHWLALAEMIYRLDRLRLRLGAFYRQIDNPVITTAVSDTAGFIYTTASANHDSRNVLGASLLAEIAPFAQIDYTKWAFTPVNLSFNLQYNHSETDGKQDRHLPELYGSVKLYSTFIVSRSLAHVGFSFDFMVKYQPDNFFQLTRLYYPSDNTEDMHSGLTFFATAKLGDAYLRLSFNNIMPKMFYVSYYPIYNTYFRLQVAWAFFD